MKLNFAEVGNVYYAQKKDKVLTEYLVRKAGKLFGEFGGQRDRIIYERELEVFGKGLYYLLTTLSGERTMGEEEYGLEQLSGGIYPSKRFLFVICHVLLPYALRKVSSQNVNPQLSNAAVKCLALYKHVKPLHFAWFCFEGIYSTFSHRVLSLRYAKNATSHDSQRTSFEVLGALVFLRSLLFLHERLIRFARNIGTEKQTAEFVEATDASSKCALCWGARQTTTATPCGHLYCWDCILQWAQSKSECPLCRQKLNPKLLNVVYNY